MNKKIGFIGAGKMTQAMLDGILKSTMIDRANIMASAFSENTITNIRQSYDITTTINNKEVASFADIIILAIKPDIHVQIIDEIKNEINPNDIIVTIAAGITLAEIDRAFGFKVKAIRTMPNTPAVVGEGMSVICPNEWITDKETAEIEHLFQTFGKTERLPEKLMDAVPAISGSSPAYVYILIEAMADGAVQQGIPREIAYRLAAQAVLGAGKMVLETGQHPAELKDNVCTPGGATIEAVAALEKEKFRGSILAAMESCTAKVKLLG